MIHLTCTARDGSCSTNPPSDWHAGRFGRFHHLVEALQTLVHGAVDVLLAEQLGCGAKYGHLGRSCLHLTPGVGDRWVECRLFRGGENKTTTTTKLHNLQQLGNP